MKFKEAPNTTNINLLERTASWSYTFIEEIMSFIDNEIVNHYKIAI